MKIERDERRLDFHDIWLAISVDRYFFPDKCPDSSCRKRINEILDSLSEKELKAIEATI